MQGIGSRFPRICPDCRSCARQSVGRCWHHVAEERSRAQPVHVTGSLARRSSCGGMWDFHEKASPRPLHLPGGGGNIISRRRNTPAGRPRATGPFCLQAHGIVRSHRGDAPMRDCPWLGLLLPSLSVSSRARGPGPSAGLSGEGTSVVRRPTGRGGRGDPPLDRRGGEGFPAAWTGPTRTASSN